MSEAQLRDRIEYLEAEVANLRTQLRLDHDGAALAAVRQAFDIEPGPAKIMLQLLDARHHSKESLFNALYVDRLDQPEPKIIDVFIFKLRRVLRPHGITVETIWSFGYQMRAADCAKVRTILGIEAQP